jgi:hypothetical protein
VHFQIDHDIEAPLESVESAVLSPDFASRLAASLPSIESLTSLTHELEEDELVRVWRFKARAPLGILKTVAAANEWLSWEERVRYRMTDHRGSWRIVPRGDDSPAAPWRKVFTAEGQYQLEGLPDGRTRRTVTGELTVRIRVLGRLAERAALGELRRAYAAEVAVVRSFSGA